MRMMREELVKESKCQTSEALLFPNIKYFVLIRSTDVRCDLNRPNRRIGEDDDDMKVKKIPNHLGSVLLVVPVSMVQPLPAQV